MSWIVIERSNEYINRYRHINIYLNGKKLGDICNGEVLTFEVEEGQHQIVAKIDWCGSQLLNFDIDENEVRSFTLSGFKHSKAILAVIVSIFLTHQLMQLLHQPEVLVWLMLPVFLMLVYYITLGRNQYLVLKQKEYNSRY